jgi:cation diffusion facilitator CzcD-associated flavoprotein CzcO
MIAFIGSGPHNLTALAFLLKADPSLRKEVVVFDPSGAWLTRWNAQLEGQEIPHLRSSSVHHPGPDPMALRRFAQGRSDEFFPPYDLPGTSLFRQFCEDLILRLNLEPLVVPRRVAEVIEAEAGLVLKFEDGGETFARAVVTALGGGEKVWPAWAPSPVAPSLVHSEDVDLRTLEPGSGRVLIVGGGLTAGHLALGALNRGWTVDLVTRRPVTYKLFDAAPGWIGPKHMVDFHKETSWVRRRAMVAEARGGGAMTEEIRDLLEPFRVNGTLRYRARCQVRSLEPREGRWRADCGWGRHLDADRVWLCTGNRLDLRSHPVFTGLTEKHPLQVVDGLPILEEDCRWPGLPLYFMGTPAALRVGPTARNFPGARQAASRIARSITGVVVPPN